MAEVHSDQSSATHPQRQHTKTMPAVNLQPPTEELPTTEAVVQQALQRAPQVLAQSPRSNRISQGALLGLQGQVGNRQICRLFDATKSATATETISGPTQQNPQALPIQRKIIVGGKPYTPTQKYYQYLQANFGQPMVEFVGRMHSGPNTYLFTSFEQMGTEVRVRHQATKGMDEANNGSSNYPDAAHPNGYLNKKYWVQKGWMHFELKKGTKPSDAIEAIFAPGAGSFLECMSMAVAVEYYSLLKGLGASKFNTMFPSGAGLEISTRPSQGTHPLLSGAKSKYTTLAVSSAKELLPGDWVYFKNFKDYSVKSPGGSWQGENAIYMGSGKYRGFGVSSMTEADMNAELVRVYNTETGAKRTVPALLKEGGGLLLNIVNRPVIKSIAP